MAPISYSVLLLLAASTAVLGQAFADLTACGQTCINNVVQKGSTYGCPDDSNACLCTKPDFSFAIHDCALQACGAAVATAVSDYATAMCATATLPVTTAAVTPSSSAPPPPPPTTTSPPPPPPPATTDGAAAATSTTDSVANSPTTSPTTSTVSLPTAILPVTTTGTTSFKSLAVEAGPSTTSKPASTLSTSVATGVTTTATSPAAATTSSAAADASQNAATGLSLGAKAGIGIGTAAGVVALIGLVLLATMRCRRRRYPKDQLTSLKISEPLPGAGQSYASDPAYSNYRNMSELEMKSRRYEDMLPRHKPRYLV